MTATTKTRKPVASAAREAVGRARDASNDPVFNFAVGLAKTLKTTLEQSESAHKAWKSAGAKDGKETEKQKAIRLSFIYGYIAGSLNTTREVAESIVAAPRFGAKAKKDKKTGAVTKARTQDQQQAYDRARKQFGFHVSRLDNRLDRGQAKLPKLSKDFALSAQKWLGTIYETVDKAAVNDVIQHLRALAKTLK